MNLAREQFEVHTTRIRRSIKEEVTQRNYNDNQLDVFESPDSRNRKKRNRKRGKINLDTGFKHEVKNLATPSSDVHSLRRQQFETHTSRVRESIKEEVTQSNVTNNQIDNIRVRCQWANNLDTAFKRILYNSLRVITDTKESMKRYKQFLTRSTENSLCNTSLNGGYQYRYDIQNIIQYLVNQAISKKQISRFGAATARVVDEHWQDLIAKGFSKADIVCISSNKGANQAIKTILEKYDALIGKGFSKADDRQRLDLFLLSIHPC